MENLPARAVASSVGRRPAATALPPIVPVTLQVFEKLHE
jgi:hypothetical protein